MPTESLENDETGDPVIDEIRAIRHRVSAEFGHDSAQLAEYYRHWQLPTARAAGDPAAGPDASADPASRAVRPVVARGG